jgi:hypothetical protein
LIPGVTERDCFASLAMTPQARHCEERSDEAISWLWVATRIICPNH